MSRAPDFNESTYPSGGKILGPAWQQMWDALEGGGWMTIDDLHQAAPQIARRTVETLAVGARRSGLLESMIRKTKIVQNRRRRFYRRPNA